MLNISCCSACELETQILLSGNLGCIEKGGLDTAKKDIAYNQKNIKSADKIFRQQTLESLDPLLQRNWRRTIHFIVHVSQ